MANQTIYPFGQGGQVPSGYPIADDLSTNSAQQALSAKQGVVLKGMVDDAVAEVQTPLSLSASITVKGVITANNVWSNGQTNHESVQIQVLPGQRMRMVANASQPSYYAFLSAYSPYSSGGSPSYATGETGRHEVTANTTTEFTIPEGCYFLYICIKNANIVQRPQSLVIVETGLENEGAMREELGEKLQELQGTFDEQVVYADLAVSAVGANITIAKTGDDGILINNVTKASSNYALIALPNTLEDGKHYTISFKYKAYFMGADAWYLGVAQSDYTLSTGGKDIYKTGYDLVSASFAYTHRSENVYLRLASNSVNSSSFVYIEGFSISSDKTSVVELETRVKNLEEGNDSFIGYGYQGEKIQLNPNQKYKLETVASNGAAGQSAALYDKYLFIVKDKFTNVILYDMDTKAQVYNLSTGVSVDTWHCNQSSFGAEKYDENDLFPVLYVSMRPDSGSTRCVINVYRIIPTLTDDAITSFSMTLVQTISLPAMTEQNGLGLANATIDIERGWMWTYSRNTTNGQSTSGLATFTRFAIPALFDGGGNAITAVTLEDSDIKDSFMEAWPIYDNQGAFIHNGKMYMMRGVPNTDHICECNVIDLYFKRTRVSRVDLYENGTRSEPEGCFYYDNTVCYTVNGAGIYRIVFN